MRLCANPLVAWTTQKVISPESKKENMSDVRGKSASLCQRAAGNRENHMLTPHLPEHYLTSNLLWRRDHQRLAVPLKCLLYISWVLGEVTSLKQQQATSFVAARHCWVPASSLSLRFTHSLSLFQKNGTAFFPFTDQLREEEENRPPDTLSLQLPSLGPLLACFGGIQGSNNGDKSAFVLSNL